MRADGVSRDEVQTIQKVWPEWKVQGLLGTGGFGNVYRVARMLGDHPIEDAVKVMNVPRTRDELEDLLASGMDREQIVDYLQGVVRDVTREVETMEHLKGAPHVVHIEDYEVVEGEDGVSRTILIRMDLLEPLPSYQKRHGMPGQREVARLGAQVCEALSACHSEGMIHCDVKPSNVFVNQFGSYELGDFGIARQLGGALSHSAVVATPAYMAPEIPSGHYNKTVDVYSLGIMLYQYLNGGRQPFLRASGQLAAEDEQNAYSMRISGKRPPLPAGPGVDISLAQIVRKACEPLPQDRWRSAEEFGAALNEWRESTGRKPQPTAQPAQRQAPRKGMDVRRIIEVNVTEAATGCVRTVSYFLPSTGQRVSCRVSVPAGVRDGAVLRFPRAGDVGTNGGSAGDLLVTIRVKAMAQPAPMPQPAPQVVMASPAPSPAPVPSVPYAPAKRGGAGRVVAVAVAVVVAAGILGYVVSCAGSSTADGNETPEIGSSSGDGSETEPTEEEVRSTLSASLDELRSLDAEVRSVAADFSKYSRSGSSSQIDTAASTAYDVESRIDSATSDFNGLSVPSSSAYYDDYQSMQACYADLQQRIYCICDSWELRQAGEKNYMSPINAQNDANGINRYKTDFDQRMQGISL